MPHEHNQTTAERLIQVLGGAGTLQERTALLCAALDQAELAGRQKTDPRYGSEIAAMLVSAWTLTPEAGSLCFHRRPEGALCAITGRGTVIAQALDPNPARALAEMLEQHATQRDGSAAKLGPTT